MGIVYRALDVKLNREVAIKALPPELTENAERKRRFVQEAQAAAALEHPHIAVIYEIDDAEGVTFIAMELIRGQKLSDLLAKEELTVARALEIVIEIEIVSVQTGEFRRFDLPGRSGTRYDPSWSPAGRPRGRRTGQRSFSIRCGPEPVTSGPCPRPAVRPDSSRVATPRTTIRAGHRTVAR